MHITIQSCYFNMNAHSILAIDAGHWKSYCTNIPMEMHASFIIWKLSARNFLIKTVADRKALYYQQERCDEQEALLQTNYCS